MDEENGNSQRITVFLSGRRLWLAICGFVLLLALASRDWILIENRNENSHIARELGFLGYMLYDIKEIISSRYDRSRIENLDTIEFRRFLEGRRIERGDYELSSKTKKHVIYLQMESVDGLCLYGDVRGAPMMPNLRRIANESVAFANNYDATDSGRTVDAEFMTLTSLPPLKGDPAFVNYELGEVPSIPKVLGEAGYRSFSMHGFNGQFWNRENAYKEIGYDKDFFEADLKDIERLGWGISDAALLDRFFQEIESAQQPVFAHAILLTHHHPYNHVGERSNRESAGIEEDYLVSLRYVDQQIGRFYDRLKDSGILDRSILAIYGDHDSGISESLLNAYSLPTPHFLKAVPMVIAGLDSEPRVIRAVSSLQDLPVIVLHELGIRPPATFLGNSLDSIGGAVTPGSVHYRVSDETLITEPFSLSAETLTKLALWRPSSLEGAP